MSRVPPNDAAVLGEDNFAARKPFPSLFELVSVWFHTLAWILQYRATFFARFNLSFTLPCSWPVTKAFGL